MDLALRIGATSDEVKQALSGPLSLIDLVWARLEALPDRWLLIVDNADDPSVLVQPGALVRDGNGIVRGSHRGTLLLTSRVTALNTWGSSSGSRKIRPRRAR
ncbi:hypothetical protein ACTMTJ_37445 [Phytohabitans sp. LJ34]|uniref:hypothetical protein n=1 Tax=Phytohabitans sp. LJ34 TaxID=3452217 RepID=UPI003F8CD608